MGNIEIRVSIAEWHGSRRTFLLSAKDPQVEGTGGQDIGTPGNLMPATRVKEARCMY